jgi:ribonuclease D
MTGKAMSTVASQAPTTLEDLNAVGVLGENVVKEYGERLVKNIKAFVELENLQKYIDRRPPKRPKTDESTELHSVTSKKPTTSKAPARSAVIDVDGEDEFDAGIDFNAIEIPDTKDSARKSHYFG